MRGCSIVVQTCFRGYYCRKKLKEAERKVLEGARVDVVYKRGRVVSGCHLFLEVKRCGLSFKFIGRSEEHMETFFGYVYRDDTHKLIESHNEKVRNEVARLEAIEGEAFAKMYQGYDRGKESDDAKQIHEMQSLMSSNSGNGNGNGNGNEKKGKRGGEPELDEDRLREIKPWQFERILKMLLEGLALVNPIKSSSEELQKKEGSKILVVEINLGSSAHGHGILVFNGQRRYLKDQKKSFQKYNKELRGRQNKQMALGIAVDTW